MPAPYPDQQPKAREALKKLFQNPSVVRVIHYSSESFDDRASGQSPRVTSIAVRRLDTGQTESFSIHSIAEEQHVPLDQIDGNYDRLEKEMLTRFYSYISQNTDVLYLHWNMRDGNYGFTALAHRFRVLGGTPTEIPGSNRFDLSRTLQEIYGTEYIGHPRIERLAEKNGITMLRFLTGAAEAEKFKDKEYVAIHQSTLRKVDIFADFADRAFHRTLKTNSSWWTQHGGSIRGAVNWLVSNPLILFLMALIAIVLAIVGIRVPVH